MPHLQYIGDEECDYWINEILRANKVLKSVYVPKLQQTMPQEYARLQSIVAQNNPQQTNLIQTIKQTHIRGA
jgi:hypothetical protein